MTAPTVDLERLSASELLAWAVREFGHRFALVTSFQREGMVLLDMAVKIEPGVRVITLDTGRLAPETYDIIERVRERYGIRVEIAVPDADETSRMVTRFGPNLFYESVAHRRLCCEIRKVRPLDRALKTVDAYAVGLRRGQSDTRESVSKAELVADRWKLSPLAEWTAGEIREYIRTNNVPEHPLYARGYPSIGCGPCTRATHPGESERAGRWWWEQGAASECGLHFSPDGKAERTVDVLLREILSD